jgi:hypothetical protein
LLNRRAGGDVRLETVLHDAVLNEQIASNASIGMLYTEIVQNLIDEVQL